MDAGDDLKNRAAADNPLPYAAGQRQRGDLDRFFQKFVAGLRSLFGGRLQSYESLLDRARREAILRMKESALEIGAKVIINVRIETASISKSSSRNNGIGSVEVVAYGTALSV